MARLTPEELEQKRGMRSSLAKEAIRLLKKPAIKAFIEANYEKVFDEAPLIDIPGAGDALSIKRGYYRIKPSIRNKTKIIVELKRLIRENIRPALLNDRVPFAWENPEDKISLLAEALPVMAVPPGEKPWLPPQAGGGQGNQGQGRGAGGNPNN